MSIITFFNTGLKNQLISNIFVLIPVHFYVVFCSCYNQFYMCIILIHTSNFVKISNPIKVNEDYFCRQILPKIGSSSNYLQKLCEGRTFPKCMSLRLNSLIGIEILSSNIQQYLLYFLNYLLTFLTVHDECSVFWECAILNKFLIKMPYLGASCIYDMKCMQNSSNCC